MRAFLMLPLSREEREAEEKEKVNIKELAKTNKLYNEKIAQEKRDARAWEKEERDRLKVEKAKEVAERKAERERQRQVRDHQKAIQKPFTGKRKGSQKAAPRKKQKRSARVARFGDARVLTDGVHCVHGNGIRWAAAPLIFDSLVLLGRGTRSLPLPMTRAG
jgi:hypothetical protein